MGTIEMSLAPGLYTEEHKATNNSLEFKKESAESIIYGATGENADVCRSCAPPVAAARRPLWRSVESLPLDVPAYLGEILSSSQARCPSGAVHCKYPLLVSLICGVLHGVRLEA
jgi:hypothetical protein